MESKGLLQVGDKYGRLIIIKEIERDKHNKRCVQCLCDCGNKIEIEFQSLRSGNTTSCGCYWSEVVRKVNITHGMTYAPLYNTWRGMKERCFNHKASNYSNYGGRGISICDVWISFEAFSKWALANGYRDNLTIERKDNDGDYEPDNCRWATRLEQNNNRRTNHMVTYQGKTKSIAEWSRITGINYNTLRDRIKQNWPIKQAIFTPVGSVKTGPKPKIKSEIQGITGIPVYV